MDVPKLGSEPRIVWLRCPHCPHVFHVERPCIDMASFQFHCPQCHGKFVRSESPRIWGA